MIRFIVRGVAWVALVWFIGASVNAWFRDFETHAVIYGVLSTVLVNSLWIERRCHLNRKDKP